jgi:hypothetical protein
MLFILDTVEDNSLYALDATVSAEMEITNNKNP